MIFNVIRASNSSDEGLEFDITNIEMVNLLEHLIDPTENSGYSIDGYIINFDERKIIILD